MTASKHQADLHASYAAWRITYQSSEQAARAAYARVQELEAQLEAIGAGGVEPLRRRECLHQIAEPASAAVAGPSDSEIDALVASIGPTEGIRRDSRDLTMDKLRVLVRRALATWGHVNAAPAAQRDAEDAARYRWLRDEGFTFADVDLGTDSDGDFFVAYRIRFHLPEPAHSKFEDNEWAGPDIDAAIDAARSQAKEGA